MKKVVIIGPESTGKSTLCAALAKYYNTEWVPEYARQYLLQHGNNYTYDQLLTIAQGQLQLEEEYTNKFQRILFLDTDMYVMKTWCEYVFQNCHHYILEQAATRNYDFYLLCNIDLPWVKDELREYPDYHIRAELFAHYKDIVQNTGVPWALVSGTTPATRTATAIQAIEKYFGAVNR
jgi:NadR type nicotinamide-nucleotide adenylyltransferase